MIEAEDLAVTLRERADGLTERIQAPPTLLHRAHTGGRRRLARRRAVEVLGVLTVSVAVVLGAVTSSGWLPRTGRDQGSLASRVYDRLGHQPAQGNLVRNAAYTTQVVAIWAASHRSSPNADRGIFGDLRGRPRVVWAGTTPAGPGAVVVQQAYLHRHRNLQLDKEGIATLVGFIGVNEAGRPRLVADSYPARSLPPTVAWWVDAKRTVLAVLDDQEDLGLAAGWTYRPDGTRSVNFTALAFRDGVALANFSTFRSRDHEPLDSTSVQVAALPFRTMTDARAIANGDPFDPACACLPVNRRLMWRTNGSGFPIAGTIPLRSYDGAWLQGSFYPALERRLHGPARVVSSSTWYAGGVLPDGGTLLVGEEALDREPSHAYLVVVTPAGSSTVVDGGPIDLASPLPIAVRLPGKTGWVVAAKGRMLSYLGPKGGWIVVGPDAALLPASARFVRVGGAQTGGPIVRLPRAS